MKKHIAKQLNKVAATMPTVLEWGMEEEEVEGSWLIHSPIADHQPIDPTKMYRIALPVLRGVDHKQQVKDTYKGGGLDAVKQYHRSVLNKIKLKNHDPNTSTGHVCIG